MDIRHSIAEVILKDKTKQTLDDKSKLLPFCAFKESLQNT